MPRDAGSSPAQCVSVQGLSVDLMAKGQPPLMRFQNHLVN